MKTWKKTLILTAVAALTAAAIGSIFFERALIYLLARNNGLDIGYSSIKRTGPGEYLARDLLLAESGSGIGLRAEGGRVKVLSLSAPDIFTVRFELNDVNFIKAAPPENLYNDPQGLVASAFGDDIVYRELSGTVKRSRGVISADEITASGDLVKVRLSGSLSDSGDVFSEWRVSFSDSMRRRIPKELSEAVLESGADGWYGFSFTIRGNVKAPSISVSGKRFRLNIKEAAGG